MKRNSKDEKHKLVNKLKSELVDMIITLRNQMDGYLPEILKLRSDVKSMGGEIKQLIHYNDERIGRINELKEDHQDEISKLKHSHTREAMKLHGRISGLEFAIETLANGMNQ